MISMVIFSFLYLVVNRSGKFASIKSLATISFPSPKYKHHITNKSIFIIFFFLKNHWKSETWKPANNLKLFCSSKIAILVAFTFQSKLNELGGRRPCHFWLRIIPIIFVIISHVWHLRRLPTRRLLSRFLSSVLFLLFIIRVEMLPQFAHDLGSYDSAGVGFDHSEYEDSVLLQVPRHKFAKSFLIQTPFFFRKLLCHSDQVFHVDISSHSEKNHVEPRKGRVHHQSEQRDEPIANKHKVSLVENIIRHRALNKPLFFLPVFDLFGEVAVRDEWEKFLFTPFKRVSQNQVAECFWIEWVEN